MSVLVVRRLQHCYHIKGNAPGLDIDVCCACGLVVRWYPLGSRRVDMSAHGVAHAPLCVPGGCPERGHFEAGGPPYIRAQLTLDGTFVL